MSDVNQSNGDAKSVVLVGLDFSTNSRQVLATAANLVRPSGGELHAIHVINGSGNGAGRGESALRFVAVADDLRAKLTQLAAAVPGIVKRIDMHVRMGKPDVEIAQLANDLAADVIVVGTHSHTALDRLLVGSTAESLLRHAPCPVMTYRPKSVRAWEQIAPPCADCAAVQHSTARARLWCDRHSEHHGRAHTYSEVPASYGIGAQTFR